MKKIIISTIGTSSITNRINNEEPEESKWRKILNQNANLKESEIEDKEVIHIIQALKERAINNLNQTDIKGIRRASAELNGIYGIYDENLQAAKEDIHYLVATDTYQGITTAKIIESYLKSQGLIADTYTPSDLSTKETDNFRTGIAALIKWMQETIPPYKKQKYKICFNLVGSFKSLQGYLNTIGMFYADEIIYIFEGGNSELIKIPRLPVKVNLEEIDPYKISLAMMNAGEIPINLAIAKNVPEEWIFSDGNQITLSTWGQLLWNQCKKQLLSQKLLEFPLLNYVSTFKEDYKQKPIDEKIALQEQLARVSCLLNSKKDGIYAVKEDGTFRMRRYTGKHKEIDHFSLPKSRRISCLAQGNVLQLRHYGEHDYVNNNP